MSLDTPFSFRTRVAALESMAAEPVDVLVIGGGITGAGIARDAALRGFRTALVDKGDFGGGTSSHSSRLIHGGIRYLEQLDFGLVFEASHERHVLLRIAPHLVRPLPFLFPVYRGARVPGWKLVAGMWLYDLLAAFRNVRLHRWLGRKAVLRLEPGLRERALRGAALYYDAQTDDARLVIATVRSAAQAGALVANYAAATSLVKPDGRARGATVRDVFSGHPYTVRALVVVNAAGPWVDELRRLDEPATEPLLRLTKGAHVAVPQRRLGHTHAVTLTSPIDGRVMFVLPWGGADPDLSYIGTTDTDEDASPDDVNATARDVIYLLRSANAFFPQARLSPHDVVATWKGGGEKRGAAPLSLEVPRNAKIHFEFRKAGYFDYAMDVIADQPQTVQAVLKAVPKAPIAAETPERERKTPEKKHRKERTPKAPDGVVDVLGDLK